MGKQMNYYLIKAVLFGRFPEQRGRKPAACGPESLLEHFLLGLLGTFDFILIIGANI